MERAGPLMEGPPPFNGNGFSKKVNISMAGRTIVLSRVLARTKKMEGLKKLYIGIACRLPRTEHEDEMCPTITRNQWST